MWRKITSIDEYKQLAVKCKYYNHGFTNEEVCKYIINSRLDVLDYLKGEQAILRFDEVNYKQYVVPVGIPAKQLMEICKAEEKPVVCYSLSNRNLRDEFEEVLKKAEFLLKEKSNEFIRVINSTPTNENKSCIKLDVTSAEECLQIWQHNLPVFQIPWINCEDIKREWIQQGRMIGFIGKDELRGVCCYDGFLGKATIRHIVVKKKYRRGGIGGQLLKACLESASLEGFSKARAWIADNNIESEKCFVREGFRKSGVSSYQYINVKNLK